jgi:hypothetical protein
MSRKYIVIAISILSALVLLPAMFADSIHEVILHVYQPVVVQRTVLEPGTYTMSFTGQNERTVLIRNQAGDAVGIFPVIAAYRGHVTDNVEIDVVHTGGEARMSQWFLPGSDLGWGFAGGAPRKHTVARADTATVSGE